MMKSIYLSFANLSWGKKVLILFVIFFPLRFCFGIFSEFWFEDELQIYLIGLKFYSGGHWPYFGPDIVYTGSQIPGALQGLLAGSLLFLFPIPEAPYILLNLINFGVLFLLGFYLIQYRRLQIPEWFLWPWLFCMPWTLSFSTHIINPSYILPAGVIFFISIVEIIPQTNCKFIKPRTAFLFLGICLLWVFQLHMSWILFLPFIFICFFLSIQKGWKEFLFSIIYFFSGTLCSGIFLIPTFINYGLSAGSGDTASNIIFNGSNLSELFAIIARLFAFGSFEVTLFTGANTTQRTTFLLENYWAIPFTVFAGIAGVVMVLWMIISWFRKNNHSGWKTIKRLVLLSIIVTYFSFFFSVKGPSPHTIYILFPLMIIYSFYCWERLFIKKWFRRLAAIFLFSVIVYQIALASSNFKHKSMYTNRAKPLRAIQQKDYKLLGERRMYDRNE